MNTHPSPFVRIQVLTGNHYEGIQAAAARLSSYTDEYSTAEIRFQLDGFSPMSRAVVQALCDDVQLEDDAKQWLHEYLTSPGSEDEETVAHYRLLTMIEHGLAARRLREQ
jgi:hypothetical protein